MENPEMEKIKNLLSRSGKIEFSEHFKEKSSIRGIKEEDIKYYLKHPEKIVNIDIQDSERGQKYAILFIKSRKYDIKIVLSISENMTKIITAHYQNKKRRKVYEKWLKKLR